MLNTTHYVPPAVVNVTDARVLVQKLDTSAKSAIVYPDTASFSANPPAYEADE